MASVQSGANDIGAERGMPLFGPGRWWKGMLLAALAATGLTLAFALFATPNYHGETRVLIEAGDSVLARPHPGNIGRTGPGGEGVASQVEVILSSDLLEQVALRFGLAGRPEFDEAADPSYLSRLLVVAGLRSDPGETPALQRVLEAFRARLAVYPIEGSGVIVIGMSSVDPLLAADIPNALADAYLGIQGSATKRMSADTYIGPQPGRPDRSKHLAGARVAGYLPAEARIFARAVAPSEPYFPKLLPIAGAAFTGSLLVMGLAILLGRLFQGRALRAESRARPEPIGEVAVPQIMPFAAREEPLPPAPVDVPMPAPRGANTEPASREIGIETAAEMLIASGAARAIFISPGGDEAAAIAVLVAREIADAGLRVLLLDLTASGAASRPMLDSISFPGVTDLLASEAQFTEVIHQDHYSDCHIIPVGTADPARAMRAADRLPIIMESLTTAYDLVAVECGPADAEGVRRLVAQGTEILVSNFEADAEVVDALERLGDGGYLGLSVVTPAGYRPRISVVRNRSAA